MILQLEGKTFLKAKTLEKGCLGIFSRSGCSINLKLEKYSKILILNGQPIDELLEAFGPFVMNTREELLEAFRDFHEGKMGNLVED